MWVWKRAIYIISTNSCPKNYRILFFKTPYTSIPYLTYALVFFFFCFSLDQYLSVCFLFCKLRLCINIYICNIFSITNMDLVHIIKKSNGQRYYYYLLLFINIFFVAVLFKKEKEEFKSISEKKSAAFFRLHENIYKKKHKNFKNSWKKETNSFTHTQAMRCSF